MAAAARAERDRLERERLETDRRENEKRDRINLLIQKRVAIEGQIDDLRLQITEEGVDIDALSMRGADVESLYQSFLKENPELVSLDRDVNHAEVLKTLQINYYNVMAQLKRKVKSTNNENNGNSPSASANEQQIKLPEIPWPTFSGKYDEWFSFKDKFTGIITPNNKLNDVSKMHALKSCLTGEAKQKLEIFRDIPGEYTKAWDYLVESYEVESLIIESHWQAIMKLPVLERESTEGLTGLVDRLLQHMGCLSRLDVVIPPIIGVQILQSRLPKHVLKKWSETVGLRELPTLEKMVDFIRRMALGASRGDKRPNPSKQDNSKQLHPASKKMRHDHHKPTHQVLTTTDNSFNCPACKKEKHFLFQCDVFKSKNLKEKYEIINRAKLCSNCLRFHKAECTYGSCKICGEKHNRLLHPRGLNKDAVTKAEVKEKTQPSPAEK